MNALSNRPSSPTGAVPAPGPARLLLGVVMLWAFGWTGCSEEAETAEKKRGAAAGGLRVLTRSTAGATSGGSAPAEPGASSNGDDLEAPDDDTSDIAYAYSPIGKRDPFRSLFDQLQREDNGAQTTELQKYELDQLKLVAIVSRIATPYGMVEDPDGKGHTLTRGTLIGKNWGRVSQITPECVVIKEEYRDYTGRKVTNKTEMCLPRPDELTLD